MFNTECYYLDNNNAELFTVVCLPDIAGKYPTVIMRSPYVDDDEFLSEDTICRNKQDELQSWLENGYAVAYQHCRGRGKSTGDCIPYIFEREDGLALQNWIRKQTFYNGELYLFGGSYTSSVHFVTAPFADDIKGAVLMIQDCERYNCNYRNGFYKIGLHGNWYVQMYKAKSMREKNYSIEKYNMLPLADFSKTDFGEKAEDFDEILKHPDRNDSFWKTRYGGGEAHEAIKHANIPILLLTGFYDTYAGGVFEMWNTLDDQTKSKSALAVHPFDHDCCGESQPINFERGDISKEYNIFPVKWFDAIRGKCTPPFESGKVTYYKLFDNKWCCEEFKKPEEYKKVSLGTELVSYEYDPNNPATFKGGLSANLGGNEWQDEPNQRDDVVTVYTPEFSEDTFVKGKMRVRLRVKSDCEDTCFYVRISLCKSQGDYGLRDDINQISNFDKNYKPNKETEIDFFFDEHAFVVKKGEKLRIDVSSSAFPFYVRHTNNKGLFSKQATAKIAANTVILDQSVLTVFYE